MAIPRKSRMTERLNKMRGLSPIEKDLMRRIGEIVDGSLNNRGPANPGTQGLRRTVHNKLLPPPRNLTVDVGPRNAKIEWKAVDSPILLLYEVQITNVITKLVQLKTAFTNRLNFGDQGTFQVKVRTVGRNGNCSPYSSTILRFTVQDELIYLEGTKVGATETTNILIEDIFTPADYRVFSWGAYNKSGFTTTAGELVPFMDLSINGFYPLISRLLMFRETEMFSNIDDSSIVGELRPGNDPRTGMFMSPMAAMFRPFYIDPGNPTVFTLANTSPKFYMFLNQITDAAGASLSLMSIPASVVFIEEENFGSTTSFETKRAATDENPVSLSVTVSKKRSDGITASYGDQPANVGNQFTIGFWIKFFDGFTTNNVNNTIKLSFDAPSFAFYDKFTIGGQIVSNNPGTLFVQFLPLNIGGSVGLKLQAALIRGTTSQSQVEARYDLVDKDLIISAPNNNGNGIQDNLLTSNYNKWMFVAATYDSTVQDTGDTANKLKLYINRRLVNQSYQRSTNTGTLDTIHLCSDMIVTETGISRITFVGQTVQSDNTTKNGIRIYWAALWDGLLGGEGHLIDLTTGEALPDEIAFLNAHPTMDLRTDRGDYQSSSKLAHWWVFGTDPTPATVADLSSDLGFGVPFSITGDTSPTISPIGTVAGLKNDYPTGVGGTSSGSGSDSTTTPPDFV